MPQTSVRFGMSFRVFCGYLFALFLSGAKRPHFWQNMPTFCAAKWQGKYLLPSMEEILHHLRCKKPCKQWAKLPINWCRISAINSSNGISPFSIGNTSSIRVHFPASYVSLPESNISQPFIPPQKPTYTLPNFNVEMKISPWKRILLLETIMFRFHLKLWGCTPWKKCCLENPSYPFKMVPFLRGKKSKALIHSREILPPFLVQKKSMKLKKGF